MQSGITCLHIGGTVMIGYVSVSAKSLPMQHGWDGHGRKALSADRFPMIRWQALPTSM